MKNKRGVTLVELSVVIALISIVSLLVMSFTVLARNYTVAIACDNAVIEDYNSINTTLSKWLSYFDNDNYYIGLSDDSSSLFVINKKDETEFFDLKLYDNNFYIIGTYGENNVDRLYTYYSFLNRVDCMSFEINQNHLNDYTMIKCSYSFTYYNRYGTQTKYGKNVIIHTVRALTLYGGNTL